MSNLPNYDELVAVRLELNRVRDQRDALQAGLTKEIRDLIRAELSAQLDTVGCQLVERDDLRKENARLVEQVERLKAELEKKWHWASRSEIELRNKAEDENARLKAEVERLEATWPRDPHHGGKVYDFSITRVAELEAELALVYSLDPLIREAVASAKLAMKGGQP
jgi:predicted nuclease with TOPRIM domain